MRSTLSNLVDNLAEGVHKINCKYGHGNKKSENFELKYKHCQYCLEYANLKDTVIV